MWWSEERIRYYITSAEHTDFHKKLSDVIAGHIKPGEKVLELGSGLGYVTERLSDMGIDIRGMDEDERVVKIANERTGKALLSLGDCTKLEPERADVILMIFFGRITEDDSLGYYMSLAKKRIIYVMSHHNGHAIKHRENRRDRTAEMLRENGIAFTAEDLTIPFDQPLKDKADADAFGAAFYSKDSEIETEETGDDEFPLVFRNNKNLTVFTLEKEEIHL